MSRRFYFIFSVLALLCLVASLWQGYEVSQLGGRLQRIDEQAYKERLIEDSLAPVQTEIAKLMAECVAPLGKAPDLDAPFYRAPIKDGSDWVRTYFLLTPAHLMLPQGQAAYADDPQHDPQLVDTLRRKADNPDAPLFNPNEQHQLSEATPIPVFGVYEVKETDFSKKIKQSGPASPYYAWHDGKQIIYMRSIPTTHGRAAEGVVLQADALQELLLPFVDPALQGASITLTNQYQGSNLAPLPLLLQAEGVEALPLSPQRDEALFATVFSAWLFCACSVLLIFGLLFVFARYERKRSDLISAVTHELRTPLTGLSLSTEMLKGGLVPAEKLQSYHNSLHRESLRLSHLVENVLSLARITRVSRSQRPDGGSCQDLLCPLIEKIGRYLEQEGFSFQYYMDRRCSLLQVQSNSLLLEQILTNLADNSIKYGRGDKPRVKVQVQQNRRHVLIRFSDKGKGMTEAMKKTLFQAFKRSREESDKPGIGLGLALSRELARSLGGDLQLEHSDERGSSFVLTLPHSN